MCFVCQHEMTVLAHGAQQLGIAGTLTLNHLSVDQEMTLVLGDYNIEKAMELSCLSAQQRSEEAIDVVLLERTPEEVLWKNKQQTKYIPFNPNDKYTVSFVKETDTGKEYRLMKGAPQVSILDLPQRLRSLHAGTRSKHFRVVPCAV